MFADVAEALGISAGAFLGIQAAVGGDAASAIEARDGIESVDHGERGKRTDARMSAQTSDAKIVLSVRFQGLFDGENLLRQGNQQRKRMLALDSEGPGEGQGSELLLAADSEQFGTEAQAMTESHGLQTVAEHGADAHQTVTIAQQRENFAAGGCRNMNSGKLPVAEKIEQQTGVAPIIFLTAASELANGQGVADQQVMAEFFEQAMEPQRITGSFHAGQRGSCELRIKRTHVVALMIERDFVFLTVCGINPADRLRADMQINSEVHCHLRLLSKPMPNDSG